MLDSKKIKLLLGEKIKELRINDNLSQEQLAEIIGMQPNSLTKIETGRTFTTAKILANICNHFNIEPSVLFSKHIEYPNEEEIHYISEIKRLLPTFDSSKLREIYNILIALKK